MNYQIVDFGTHVALCEVKQTTGGALTKTASVSLTGENKHTIRADLERLLAAFSRPVLTVG